MSVTELDDRVEQFQDVLVFIRSYLFNQFTKGRILKHLTPAEAKEFLGTLRYQGIPRYFGTPQLLQGLPSPWHKYCYRVCWRMQLQSGGETVGYFKVYGRVVSNSETFTGLYQVSKFSLEASVNGYRYVDHNSSSYLYEIKVNRRLRDRPKHKLSRQRNQPVAAH